MYFTHTWDDDRISVKGVLSLHSNQDPSGLLLLPPKGAPSDFDISPILVVMETLLLVASKEVISDFHYLFECCTTSAGASNRTFLMNIWSFSVRWWWWTGRLEPAGRCCCLCSGLCRAACFLGATCSSKVELPHPPHVIWPETSF